MGSENTDRYKLDVPLSHRDTPLGASGDNGKNKTDALQGSKGDIHLQKNRAKGRRVGHHVNGVPRW